MYHPLKEYPLKVLVLLVLLALKVQHLDLLEINQCQLGFLNRYHLLVILLVLTRLMHQNQLFL